MARAGSIMSLATITTGVVADATACSNGVYHSPHQDHSTMTAK